MAKQVLYITCLYFASRCLYDSTNMGEDSWNRTEKRKKSRSVKVVEICSEESDNEKIWVRCRCCHAFSSFPPSSIPVFYLFLLLLLHLLLLVSFVPQALFLSLSISFSGKKKPIWSSASTTPLLTPLWTTVYFKLPAAARSRPSELHSSRRQHCLVQQ